MDLVRLFIILCRGRECGCSELRKEEGEIEKRRWMAPISGRKLGINFIEQRFKFVVSRKRDLPSVPEKDALTECRVIIRTYYQLKGHFERIKMYYRKVFGDSVQSVVGGWVA